MPDSASRSVGAEYPPALTLSRLTLSNFRNHTNLRLDLAPEPVVLFGPNGAGKTNILEAVSFLASGRGLRRARLADVDHQAAPTQARHPWAVAAILQNASGVVEIGTGRDASRDPSGDSPGDSSGEEKGGEDEPGSFPRRLVRIDGKMKTPGALDEHVGLLWVTPAMDRLFTGPSADRRRFLDQAVGAFDPAHGARLRAYEKALRERSKLLREQSSDSSWLGALEETMATQGVALAAARLEGMARLSPLCEESQGPFPGAVLRLEGEVESWLEAMPALAAEEKFVAVLTASRRLDGETGGAACGPHRSDLKVSHGPKGVAAESCSTGEQKALLIALVLASVRLIGMQRGTAPLLLLDEVAAHLDGSRRAALFARLCELKLQAWMTGTEESLFSPLDRSAQFFEISGPGPAPVLAQ